MVKDKKAWINLNVGGQYFFTSRATLTRLVPSSSPLHRISTNSTHVHFDRDDRGAYLIDRDPVYFSVVLNYLRHGHVLITRDVTEEGVLLEAEYFGLPSLAAIMRQRMGQHYLMSHPQLQLQQQASYAPQHQQHQQFQDLLQSWTTTTQANSNSSNNNHMTGLARLTNGTAPPPGAGFSMLEV